jgi:hypothetical protein
LVVKAERKEAVRMIEKEKIEFKIDNEKGV